MQVQAHVYIYSNTSIVEFHTLMKTLFWFHYKTFIKAVPHVVCTHKQTPKWPKQYSETSFRGDVFQMSFDCDLKCACQTVVWVTMTPETC